MSKASNRPRMTAEEGEQLRCEIEELFNQGYKRRERMAKLGISRYVHDYHVRQLRKQGRMQLGELTLNCHKDVRHAIAGWKTRTGLVTDVFVGQPREFLDWVMVQQHKGGFDTTASMLNDMLLKIYHEQKFSEVVELGKTRDILNNMVVDVNFHGSTVDYGAGYQAANKKEE